MARAAVTAWTAWRFGRQASKGPVAAAQERERAPSCCYSANWRDSVECCRRRARLSEQKFFAGPSCSSRKKLRRPGAPRYRVGTARIVVPQYPPSPWSRSIPSHPIPSPPCLALPCPATQFRPRPSSLIPGPASSSSPLQLLPLSSSSSHSRQLLCTHRRNWFERHRLGHPCKRILPLTANEAMATDQREDVYATLLLNDFYLPGALVLAHSLRDNGTTKKLAVLVTTDTVSADAMVELQRLYDFIIPVDRLINETPANLSLMNRTDLHSTFTKIALWKLVQFRKIVYVDADIVSLRAPDELFDLPHEFSAAPDIGWPDIFNTGLMVLTPNMGDYYALLAMAQRGISFDGADQGLLNMHFKNTFNRLSFTYNVTPSAHYQYLPAFRHFQSSISMAHFIGQEKPWTKGRDASQGSTPYDEMVGRWWAVYDRHYRESVGTSCGDTDPAIDQPKSVESSSGGATTIVHYHTKGEFRPAAPSSQETHSHEPEGERYPYQAPQQQSHPVTEVAVVPQYHYNEPQGTTPPPQYQYQHSDSERNPVTAERSQSPLPLSLHAISEQPRDVAEAYIPPAEITASQGKAPEVPYISWDARTAPPPADSRPEASNFPGTHYEMSSDPTPFKAPDRYPEPPKDMYYEVPKTPSYQKPAPIFPWEKDAPKATRVFPEDNVDFTERRDEPTKAAIDTFEEDKGASPVTPTTPTFHLTAADPWQTFTSRNAWDDIPEIERYIGSLQKNRKGNIQVLQGYGSGVSQVSSPVSRRHSIRLTDFPTEVERPSLPVTPAPIRRPFFWGEERDEQGELPGAEGVPSQADWDPVMQLEQLARRQSDVLASKLGLEGASGREIPTRNLPYGSEGVVSPTYVPQAPLTGTTTESEFTPRLTVIEQPSYTGPGAMWDRDDERYPERAMPAQATEEEMDFLEV